MDIRRSAGTIAVLAVFLAAGCAPTPTAGPAPTEPSLSAPSTASEAPAPEPSPSATPSPTPSPTPTSELNGLPQPSPAPVLVVKLDNTRNAQPHAGLHEADVVYVEEVEYGITRLAAVFSTVVPDRIGPVRSARITDIDLLEQYGSPAFSFSGVQRKMWPVIADSSLIDISPNKSASAYQRDSARRAPYNYFLNGQAGLAAAPDASLERDIGFVFDTKPPAGGRVGISARVEWPASSAEFRYEQTSRLYRVELNDEAAQAEEHPEGQRAATVVIQYVEQSPSKFFDKGGGNTPHAETIGEGEAVILRDGLRYQARWSRPDGQSGTEFLSEDGEPIAFKPGQLWVVLADETRPATFFPELDGPQTDEQSGDS